MVDKEDSAYSILLKDYMERMIQDMKIFQLMLKDIMYKMDKGDKNNAKPA